MLPHNKGAGSSPASYKNFKVLLERGRSGRVIKSGWVGLSCQVGSGPNKIIF
jgi:hypothetical protein